MSLHNFACACAAIMLIASTTRAHGPQLQITATGGKITTHEILLPDANDAYAPLANPKTVYVMEILDYRGGWYARPDTELIPPGQIGAGQPAFYSGPGLAFGLGQTFSVGTTLSINFSTGLQLWNGTSFGDAGPTELEYYRGGSIGLMGELIGPTASIATVDGSSSAALAFTPIASGYDEKAHSTARLRFLGDGMTSTVGSGLLTGTLATEPAAGVYLASLVLSSSDSAVADSDPYYFVMHKGVPWSDVGAAVNTLRDTLNVPNAAVQVLGVPEPSALLLALFGTSVVLSVRRSSP